MSETFAYVGCVHDASADILAKLAALQANPPQYLIFCGDVTGSPEMEKLKQLFYNEVYNPATREPDLGLPATAEGYKNLLAYQYELDGLDTTAAEAKAEQLSPAAIQTGIKHTTSYEFYGEWLATLSARVQAATQKNFPANTTTLLTAIKPLQAKGTNIMIVEGNWDRNDIFDPTPLFKKQGVTIYNQISTLATESSLHIFIPYWELTKNQSDIDDLLTQTEKQVAYARQIGKTVILVAHAEPTWIVHNLTARNPSLPPGGTRQKVITNLDAILCRLLPDEVIYPHQHQPIKNEAGELVGTNAKYMLQVNGKRINLINDASKLGQANQIIASYLPYHTIGRLDIPTNGNPRPQLFGGSRQPVTVI